MTWALTLAGCFFDGSAVDARLEALAAPCAGEVDAFVDADGDGLGDPERPVRACPGAAGLALAAGDCDAADGSIGASRWVDADGDGHAGTPGEGCEGADAPTDCDDADPEVLPGAIDFAGDGLDQDCDGVDALSGTWFVPEGADLQAVVDGASNGDTVLLEPGAVFGPVDLSGRSLALLGADPAGPRPTLAGTGTEPAVRMASGELGHVDLTGDRGALDGGCVVVEPGAGVLVHDVAFLGCRGGLGAALHASASSGLTLTDVVVRDARSVSGAVVLEGCPGATITGLSVENSEADTVAGVLLLESLGVTVADSAFRDLDGLGLGADASGGLRVVGSTFVDVRSILSDGGGLGVRGGSVEVEGCTFTDNATALRGGGLWVEDGDLTVRDTVFAGNTASSFGGAIGVSGAERVELLGVSATGDEVDGGASGAAVHLVAEEVLIDGFSNLSTRSLIALFVDAADMSLERVHVRSTWVGLDLQGERATLDRVLVANAFTGIDSDALSLVARHLTVADCGVGLSVAGGFFGPQPVSDFILAGNGDGIGPGSGVGLDHGVFFDSGDGSASFRVGVLEVDPLFVGPGDFTLQAGSPALGASADGSNWGYDGSESP